MLIINRPSEFLSTYIPYLFKSSWPFLWFLSFFTRCQFLFLFFQSALNSNVFYTQMMQQRFLRHSLTSITPKSCNFPQFSQKLLFWKMTDVPKYLIWTSVIIQYETKYICINNTENRHCLSNVKVFYIKSCQMTSHINSYAVIAIHRHTRTLLHLWQ